MSKVLNLNFFKSGSTDTSSDEAKVASIVRKAISKLRIRLTSIRGFTD